MHKIKIISDSTCDLSTELIKKYDIEIVYLYINLGDEISRDTIDVSPQDIFDYVQKTKILPGTVAASIADFKDAFERYTKEGFEIICFTISSEMSSTYQNACIAAQDVDGVYIVDTRNLSTGGGHIVLNAALMVQSGMEASDIVSQLKAMTSKVRASFILDNLDYMRKGGRCSAIAALGANLLKIKPTILVENGKMKVGNKFRGTLQKVLEEYVDMQLAGRNNIRTDRIFVTHTGCTKEIVDFVKARISEHIKFDEIIETTAGSTITSHCGPNTLGILFVEK
jgi:DegV family protein with EDD domain